MVRLPGTGAHEGFRKARAGGFGRRFLPRPIPLISRTGLGIPGLMADDRTEAPSPAGAPPTAPVPAASPAEPTEDWATRFKYLFADFENYRRRAERERESVTRQSRAAILRELLPILEAVRSARDAVRELPATDPVRRGFDLLDREWSTFLKHEGVEPIARLGQPFRADEAEAVAEAPPTSSTSPPPGAAMSRCC